MINSYKFLTTRRVSHIKLKSLFFFFLNCTIHQTSFVQPSKSGTRLTVSVLVCGVLFNLSHKKLSRGSGDWADLRTNVRNGLFPKGSNRGIFITPRFGIFKARNEHLSVSH